MTKLRVRKYSAELSHFHKKTKTFSQKEKAYFTRLCFHLHLDNDDKCHETSSDDL